VFSLALVVAELVTGKAPLQGDDFVQLGFASANPSSRPTPRSLGAPISDEVEAVFSKAIAVKPEERYQSAGGFWNPLRQALDMTPMRSRESSLQDQISKASTLAVPSSVVPSLAGNMMVPVAPTQVSVPIAPMSSPSNAAVPPATQTPVIVPPTKTF